MTNRYRYFRPLSALFAMACCVAMSAVTSGATHPERAISLAGTSNTRDIGGYGTDDDQQVRWTQVIRSDNLAHLTTDDVRALEALGLRTIVDLRTAGERQRDPTVWPGQNAPEIIELPIGRDDGDWMSRLNRMLATGRFNEQAASQHMIEAYRQIGNVAEDQFRQLMTLVSDETRRPILIHCTSGKDRTGVATALILASIGVAREDIMQDYLLTNDMARVEERLTSIAREYGAAQVKVGQRTRGGTPRPAAFLPLVGVTPEMLEAFYAGIDDDYGSMDAYLTAIGLDTARRQALTESLTE